MLHRQAGLLAALLLIYFHIDWQGRCVYSPLNYTLWHRRGQCEFKGMHEIRCSVCRRIKKISSFWPLLNSHSMYHDFFFPFRKCLAQRHFSSLQFFLSQMSCKCNLWTSGYQQWGRNLIGGLQHTQLFKYSYVNRILIKMLKTQTMKMSSIELTLFLSLFVLLQQKYHGYIPALDRRALSGTKGLGIKKVSYSQIYLLIFSYFEIISIGQQLYTLSWLTKVIVPHSVIFLILSMYNELITEQMYKKPDLITKTYLWELFCKIHSTMEVLWHSKYKMSTEWR